MTANPHFIQAHIRDIIPVVKDIFLAPPAASTNNLKSAQNIASGSVHITAFDKQPSPPRKVSLTFVDSVERATAVIKVVTPPYVDTAAVGTVVVGSPSHGNTLTVSETLFKPAAGVGNTFTYGDVVNADDLAAAIATVSYIASAVNTSGTIAVAYKATAAAEGNGGVLAKTGSGLTVSQPSGGYPVAGAVGTVVVGSIGGTDAFKIREKTAGADTTFTYNASGDGVTTFKNAADLASCIATCSYIQSATNNSGTITVTYKTTADGYGNGTLFSQVNAHLTLTQPSGGHAAAGATCAVTVGSPAVGNYLSIKETSGGTASVFYFGDWDTADELAILIGEVSYIDTAVNDSGTITVTTLFSADNQGNGVSFTTNSGSLTCTNPTGGHEADHLKIGFEDYKFVSGAPGENEIQIGDQEATATNIAEQLTTDVASIPITSAEVDGDHSTWIDLVALGGSASNSMVFSVDGNRLTSTGFSGGEDAGGITGNLVIKGASLLGVPLIETIEIDTTLFLTYITANAYATLTSVAGDLEGCQASNTLALGVTNFLQLLYTCHRSDDVVREEFGGVAVTSGTGDIEPATNTYDVVSTLNGTADLAVYYKRR